MPEIKRFNKATLRKYMQVPKDRWSPIPSPDDIHMGMVIRNPDEPDNPVFYLYVMTETPVKGHHLVKSLDGTRESKVMPKALVKRYHYYTGHLLQQDFRLRRSRRKPRSRHPHRKRTRNPAMPIPLHD